MEELEIIRGDDTTIDFTYKTSTGGAIDITGYALFLTAKLAIDDDVTDGDAVISVDVISHSDPAAGESTITLTDSDTNVAPSSYLADIQLRDGSNNIVSSNKFYLIVSSDVTRRITT